jgi:hypothetical protein
VAKKLKYENKIFGDTEVFTVLESHKMRTTITQLETASE